jgi:hypothetical protein
MEQGENQRNYTNSLNFYDTMIKDENGRKNHPPVSVSAFYRRKQDRVQNSRE